MREVIAGFHSKSTAEKLAARGALLRLLAWLSALPGQLDASEISWRVASTSGRDPRIDAVCRHIDDHLAGSLSLAELSQIAHLSAAHFGVVFRTAMGISPLAYVRRRRIEAAKARLAKGGQTVESIAREVGFDDPYHFSRVFRRTVGVPPSAYAESIKRPFF
jgi:AraC-like DNA-binding protein